MMAMNMGRTSRKMTMTLIVLLIVVLIASQESNKMGVAAESTDPCIEGESDPELKCFGKCFHSGKCNECCQKRGFVRGKCSSLACYCCREKLITT